MLFRFPLAALALAVVFAGCEAGKAVEKNKEVQEVILPPERSCGDSELLSVQSEDGPSLGVFEVLNDTHRLWLSFSHTQRYAINEIKIFVGTSASMPYDESGNLDVSKFNIHVKEFGDSNRWFYHLPLDDIPECATLAAQFELIDEDKGGELIEGWAVGNDNSEEDGFSIHYCPRPCISQNNCRSTDAGEFVTLTSQDWKEEGGRWRELLENQFEEAFPTGMELGCDNYLRLRSPAAALKFLGHGGPASSLDRSFIDPPVKGIQNDLADALCAITLCMEMDEAFEDFCASDALLGNLEIAGGPFKGWKVKEMAIEGNAILGGCTSNYSAGQIHHELKKINANFQGGNASEGYLACPKNDL